ncbi:hypothetical protein AVEN_254022-1 [Araneus ventricosus]|uniref:Uncharacterized protein n=1 Tax=Araneus ventricosus TaxID=182803 RepID=A0A4Y2E6I4_ARAVE|nr:hypothetical protein AVEN_254022-1 [Araneus ventricosus]
MINKPRATSDEGNQLKGSNSVQARRLSSMLPQRLVHRRCGLAYAACTHSSWSGLTEGTPIYTWMNSARAELFSILHGRIPPAASWQSERRKCKGSRGRHSSKTNKLP